MFWWPIARSRWYSVSAGCSSAIFCLAWRDRSNAASASDVFPSALSKLPVSFSTTPDRAGLGCHRLVSESSWKTCWRGRAPPAPPSVFRSQPAPLRFDREVGQHAPNRVAVRTEIRETRQRPGLIEGFQRSIKATRFFEKRADGQQLRATSRVAGIGRRLRRQLPPHRQRLAVHRQRLGLVADLAGQLAQLEIRLAQRRCATRGRSGPSAGLRACRRSRPRP